MRPEEIKMCREKSKEKTKQICIDEIYNSNNYTAKERLEIASSILENIKKEIAYEHLEVIELLDEYEELLGLK